VVSASKCPGHCGLCISDLLCSALNNIATLLLEAVSIQD
jgi:hypothetical protein